MTNDPILIAARENIGGSLSEIRKAVAALTPDQLNARPAGEGSNPLGVIAIHALGSTRSWLALATGAPLPPAIARQSSARSSSMPMRSSRTSTSRSPRSWA